MEKVLMMVMAVGMVVGGIDRILGNRYGYGAKFEEGFMLLGPTALSMVGMICIAPVLSDILGSVIVPVYRWFGVDPGMFGSILAIDMGGYQLAGELAVQSQIGSYAGIVVSSIFGCTVVFTIPVGMGMTDKEDQYYFAKGIMIGLATMPVGLFAGGLLCGLSVFECLRQNSLVFLLSLLLFVGLWRIPQRMIRGFCVFAGIIRVMITIGLMLGAIEYLCEFSLIKGLTPITEAMKIVSSIGIVMLGSLPTAEFFQRIFRKPFLILGARAGMKPEGVTGLLIGSVSAIPAISMFRAMDVRSKVINAAFLVSAASLFSAHMGFVLGTQPQLLGALIGAKMCGGAAAFLLAFFLGRHQEAKE